MVRILHAQAGANGQPDRESDGGPGLATTCLAGITPEPVQWLVPGYLPQGKLVLLAGDGGHGKSTLTLDLAARLTTGRPCLGLDYPPPGPCEVLLVNCEDDFADTVVPRLLAAGANLNLIHRVDGVRVKDDKPAPFTLAHYEALERELKARPHTRLVVIDPAGAYIGGRDDYNDSELRQLLGPMAELAARQQVTVVLVKHLVKGATVKAMHKVGGSVGYVNAVRAAFLLAPDPGQQSDKLLLPLKFNIAPMPPGLKFCREPLPQGEADHILNHHALHLGEEDRRSLANQLNRIRWLGTTDATADEVVAAVAAAARGPGKVDQAADWLREFLGTYAYPADEVVAAGLQAGHKKENIWRAKKRLKEEGVLDHDKRGFKGAWWWGPGEAKGWTDRPQGSGDEWSSDQSPQPDDTDAVFPENATFATNGDGPTPKVAKNAMAANAASGAQGAMFGQNLEAASPEAGAAFVQAEKGNDHDSLNRRGR